MNTINEAAALRNNAEETSMAFRMAQLELIEAMRIGAKDEVLRSLNHKCSEANTKAENAWRKVYGERHYTEQAIKEHTDETFNAYLNSPLRITNA
jgi:DnaJ-domain-containing protein 1